MSIAKLPDLPQNYDPLEDKGEYMNVRHLAFFKKLLEQKKAELIAAMDPKIRELSHFDITGGDEGDRVAEETQRSINLRIADRNMKLLRKIDKVLRKIDTGEYGYCEISGEEIGLLRLIARPMATMTLEEQAKYENRERAHAQFEENEQILSEGAPDTDDDK